MSLFQCELCGCVDNTSTSNRGFQFHDCWDWTGREELKGKWLCSACGPTHFSDGAPDEDRHGWHGSFERKFYVKGSLFTDKVGNVSPKTEWGDTTLEELRVANTGISVVKGVIAKDFSDTNLWACYLVGSISQELFLCSYNESDVRHAWVTGSLNARFTDTQDDNYTPHAAHNLKKVYGLESFDLHELLTLLVGASNGWPSNYGNSLVADITPLTQAEKDLCAPVLAKYKELGIL